MQAEGIPFTATGYFSALICDYLKEATPEAFYHFPDLYSFKEQLLEKQAAFPQHNRRSTRRGVRGQYKGVAVSPKTKNIALLKESNTFTVVTGHQLNLFTGPLYFLYKIISTINLTEELKKAYPETFCSCVLDGYRGP